jgi:hypothetical protein
MSRNRTNLVVFVVALPILLMGSRALTQGRRGEQERERDRDRELAQNGGFEVKGSAVPQGWTWDVKQTGGKGRITTDTGTSHSGHASLKLEPNQRNGGDQPLAVSQIINGAPYRGRKVRFSAYMKADGGATAVIAMMSLVRGKPTNLVGDAQGTSGKDWVQHGKEYDVPDDPSVQLVVICSVNGRSGAAWFDDVSVTHGGEQSAARH